MKLLMIYCNSFAYTPRVKTLEDAAEAGPASFSEVQAIFLQAEMEDEEREAEVTKKALKNIKWVCGKNNCRHVILHSFAHLSESKAEPGFTRNVFDNLQERLENAGYTVDQTPFGYFLDLNLEAPGFSLARVFKAI